MDFWERCEQLLSEHTVVIERPKGTTHPRYPECVYPLDYGYLEGTSAGDADAIDVWRGSMPVPRLVGIVCTVDMLKCDAEMKLLVGCSDDEMRTVEKFHNENAHMSGIVVLREAT